MNVLAAIILLGLSTRINVALIQRLRRHQVAAAWWATLTFLLIAGLAIGSWCTFSCKYSIGTQSQFIGFPIPVAVILLEGGQWLILNLPTFPACLVRLANIMIVLTLTTFPIWLAFWREFKHDNAPVVTAKPRLNGRFLEACVILATLVTWMNIFEASSMPDPPDTRDGWGGYPPIFLITAALSLSAVIILKPVLRWGSLKQRIAAAFLVTYPLLIFTILVWWMFGGGRLGIVDNLIYRILCW